MEIPFDPADPFPLRELTPELYPAAKRHAAEADVWLGLRVKETEAAIRDPGDGQQRWLGTHPSVFLTPYVELREWCEALRPGRSETVCDLGAGYGRLGFVLARHFPEARFLGLELVPERVKEGSRALGRFGARNASLVQADLKACPPPAAEVYFVYDYGTRETIEKTLQDLQAIAASRRIRVVARGRAVRDAVERRHPWLGSVHAPLHRAHYSVYRTFAVSGQLGD